MQRAILLLLAIVSLATLASGCPSWTLYKQCDSKWGNYQLGTSSYNTICSAGCAMSSLAMALASYGEKVGSDLVNPGNLNTWLKNNDGYVDGDLLVWAASDPLGAVKFVTKAGYLSNSELGSYISNCQPVIANVRGGSHWVLVTGSTSTSGVWAVNDPGYSSTTYPQSEMIDYAIYRISTKSKTARRFRPLVNPEYQQAEAILEDWQTVMLNFAEEQ